MKPGDIIYLDYKQPTKHKLNGLKVVIKIDENQEQIYLCNLDIKGNLTTLHNRPNKCMCSIVKLYNPAILPTKLSYDLKQL